MRKSLFSLLFGLLCCAIPTHACSVSISPNRQCGGVAYCLDRSLNTSTLCRNTTSPWNDACCTRNTRCTRKSATTWRCLAPSTKPPPSPSPALNSLSPVARATLQLHNEYRAKHRAPALSWNTEVQNSAQAWADRCMFRHDPSNRKYGENLYMISIKQDPVEAVKQATFLWYDEMKYYNYNNPTFSPATGHATCLLWKTVRRLGCVVKVCGGGSWTYVVCRYDPPCNYIGQFRENVLPPR